MVDVYAYLAQLDDLPIAVIQSTNDRYLPAAKAREQFGPDTPHKWFQSIEATNHNFGGARDRMYDAIQAALNWVTTGAQQSFGASLNYFPTGCTPPQRCRCRILARSSRPC